jgi:hypothetical protein
VSRFVRSSKAAAAKKQQQQQRQDIGIDSDPQSKLRNNLSRFARSSDRRMIVRTVKECNYLRNIPLEASSNPVVPNTELAWEGLEQELARSGPIELNGVTLNHRNDAQKQSSANATLVRGASEATSVLPKLCSKLVEELQKQSGDGGGGGGGGAIPPLNFTGKSLYRQLLLRLQPSARCTDAYFQIHSVMACTDLLVQQIDSQNSNNTKKNKKKDEKKPVTQLTLYVADDAVHCIITTRHRYGLFRKSDLTTANKPWVNLTGTVHERCNLTTGASVRRVEVTVNEPEYY